MRLLKDLPELVDSRVITQESAEAIRQYYQAKNQQQPNRILVFFGVLGSLLVGLGVILILAHNWDELSRPLKTSLAFLPLVMGQAICGFVLAKKRSSKVWRESSATFLFFAIGASISLVGQIYHIPGKVSSFLATWCFLALPLVYLLRSSVVAVLYLAAASYFVFETEIWKSWRNHGHEFIHWLMLVLLLPYYLWLVRVSPKSWSLALLNWTLPLFIVLSLLAFNGEDELFMALSFLFLFASFFLLSRLPAFRAATRALNGYYFFGLFGVLGMLIAFSFSEVWLDVIEDYQLFVELPVSQTQTAAKEPLEVWQEVSFWLAGVLLLVVSALLLRVLRLGKLAEAHPVTLSPIIFLVGVFIALFSPIAAAVWINLYVLGIGVLLVRSGTQQQNLRRMNLGLLVVSAVILCRFLDSDFSFLVRGLAFILLGVGFFIANYQFHKKKQRGEGY